MENYTPFINQGYTIETPRERSDSVSRRKKQVAYDEWFILILWFILLICEIVLIALSLVMFFRLVDGVVDFKSKNDLNFKLPTTYILPDSEETPVKLSDDVFAPIADYLENHFMTHLKSKGIWDGDCQANIEFDTKQIRKCVDDYCAQHQDDISCQSYLNKVDNHTNVIPMVLEHFNCEVNMYLKNKENASPVPVKIVSKEGSVQFTTSIKEAQRLLLVYKVPLMLTIDEYTIKPFIRVVKNNNYTDSNDHQKEIALSQEGNYLATPSLDSTGKIKNILLVGWNDNKEGLIFKEHNGPQFGHSKAFWEGEQTEQDDYERCGGKSMFHWNPINPQSKLKKTPLRVDLDYYHSHFPGDNQNFTKDGIYYVIASEDGSPSMICGNKDFGLYSIWLTDEEDQQFILFSSTVTMLEHLLIPVEVDYRENSNCGYSLMNYDVFMTYLNKHQMTGSSPIGFYRIDFDYEYPDSHEWNIC